jgi:tetratricopeptide (TPR) repeat protein
MHLGHSRRHVGDASAALADLGRARDGFEQIGNRASLIHVCAGLAEVYTDLGRYDQALEAAGRSLDVSTGGTIDVYDPWTLCTTARAHVALGHEDLARRAAARAVDALGRTFDGETHRVAAALSWVAYGLGEHRAALRLAGLADATPDRRELPFRSPGEHARLDEARDGSRDALGSEGEAIYARGTTSSPTEAAALLIHPR